MSSEGPYQAWQTWARSAVMKDMMAEYSQMDAASLYLYCLHPSPT